MNNVLTRLSKTQRWLPRPAGERLVLIPRESMSGRSLIALVAIMTFLTILALGLAMLIRSSSKAWVSNVGSEMTIQVKPAPSRDIEKDVKEAADIARSLLGNVDIRVYDQAASAALLEPWIGNGIDLKDMPVPRLISIRKLNPSPIDEKLLRETLLKTVPGAVLDNHNAWSNRLARMAGIFELVAALLVVMIGAVMTIAIFFAVRGALSATRQIIDVLHFVGATDAYISREFERHFRLQGFLGSCLGLAVAIVLFAALKSASRLWTGSGLEQQSEIFFGSFTFSTLNLFLLIAVCPVIAWLCGQISKRAVLRQLRELYQEVKP